jgi:hypothetical protein
MVIAAGSYTEQALKDKLIRNSDKKYGTGGF